MAEPRAALDLRQVAVLVAVHLFGWVQRPTESNSEQMVTVPPSWTDFTRRRWLGHRLDELVPPYSSSWEAAGQVVERMRVLGYDMSLFLDGHRLKPWDCRMFQVGGRRSIAWAETAPLAVCLAALSALGVDVPQ